MIIWSGLGILVIVFVVGAALLMDFAVDAAMGPNYSSTHSWPLGLALLLAAVACWYVGTYLRNRNAQTVVDPATGKATVIPGHRASLFFISMHHWGVILGLLALIRIAGAAVR